MTTGATAVELATEARGLGYPDVSVRLIHDWVALGLLDKPTVVSRGRHGRIGLFDETQRELFFTLLAERRRYGAGRQIIPHLCNSPVLIWLWCGSSCTPLRQTRRALMTWSEVKASSWQGCVDWAYRITEPFGYRRRAGRPPDLVHRLATLLYRGQLSRTTLAAALREALSQVPVPPEASAIQQWISQTPSTEPCSATSEELADHVAATIGTRHETCRRLGQIPDVMFEWARGVHMWKYPMYLASRLRLPQIPSPLDIFDTIAPEFPEIEGRACFDLVDVLGQADNVPSASRGTIADPQFWVQHNLRVDGLQVVTPSGVVLFDFAQHAPHRVFETLQEAQAHRGQ